MRRKGPNETCTIVHCYHFAWRNYVQKFNRCLCPWIGLMYWTKLNLNTSIGVTYSQFNNSQEFDNTDT